MASTEVAHATADEETKGLLEFYPPHPPRKETKEYAETHKLLVHTLDQPCRDCGVRNSKLSDPVENPLKAKQIETHHWPLQREFADALDPAKVHLEYPEVTDRQSLNKFIDSPKNMLVLCVTGDTKVLLANGQSRKIADIKVGERVLGHDLQPHTITGVMNRLVNETMYKIMNVKMTANHPVLTDDGFIEASLMKKGQVIYKVGVFRKQMLFLRTVKPQIINSVILPIAINMMNSFRRFKFTTKVLLHDISVFLHSTIFTLANPNINAYVSFGSNGGRYKGFETALLRIQQFQAATIRTSFFNSSLKLPIVNQHILTTNGTLNSTLRRTNVLTMFRRAFFRACTVPKRQISNNLKFSTTNNTALNNILVRLGLKTGWVSINHIDKFDYSGIVYDIQVEGSHSFIANSIAVHNCDIDHRSPTRGIHHINESLEACKRFLLDGYIIADLAKNEVADLALDEKLTAGETDQI